MTLKSQLTEDMKTALKAGDKDRLKVVRLMLAAIKQVEVDQRTELDDAAVLQVLGKIERFDRHLETFVRVGRQQQRVLCIAVRSVCTGHESSH